jgi:hypothetical protein
LRLAQEASWIFMATQFERLIEREGTTIFVPLPTG